MTLKIRLRRQGKTNRPSYRLVVADVHSPRDGKYLETLGWYNPIESLEERTLSVDPVRIQHWLDQGAQLTEKAEKLVARAAPAVIRALKEKQMARQATLRQKKKASRKKAA